MSPVRIVGIGSPFGQDQLGWQAVEALFAADLLQRYSDGFVSLHQCDRPGTHLLNVIRGADGVVIIDALQSGAAPGTLRYLEPQAFASEADRFSSHGFGVGATLELGQALGELPEYVRILAIEMDPASAYSTALTPQLIQNLLGIITNEINAFISESNLVSS